MATPGNFDQTFQIFANRIYQNPGNLNQDVQQFIGQFLDHSKYIVFNIASIIQKVSIFVQLQRKSQINDKKILWYYFLDICIKNYPDKFRNYIKQIDDIFIEDLVLSINNKQYGFFRNLVKVILSWDGGLISFKFLKNVFSQFQDRKKKVDILDYLTKEDIMLTQQHYQNQRVEGKMLHILEQISSIQKQKNDQQNGIVEQKKQKKIIQKQDDNVSKKRMKKTSLKQNGIYQKEIELSDRIFEDFFIENQKMKKLKYLTQDSIENLFKQISTQDSSQGLKYLYSSNSHLCPNCGIQLDSKDKLKFHLDEHYQQNFKQSINIQLNQKTILTKNEFLNNSKFVACKNNQKQKKQKESHIVKFIDDINEVDNLKKGQCSICGFQISIFYDANFKDWFYKNAVLLEKNDKTYKVHQKCYLKIEKQANNVEEESEQEEA